MRFFAPSELPINEDGSAFHIHLTPSQLADRVVLVGDPDRVPTVAAHFATIDFDQRCREFHSIRGTYKGKQILVLSHGIGCDNIDIVVNELDALANIDFTTRQEYSEHRTLTLVRVGTTGGLQPTVPIGTFIASVKSIGFDGLLNYYADRDKVCDLDMERAFVEHMQWDVRKGAPYVATACRDLIATVAQNDMARGITISCGGFYGPQGRQLRAAVADPAQNAKVETFRYDDLAITNFEMESSALAGLAALLGHRAMTCCMVIANRHSHEMNTNYKTQIDDLISLVLDRI